MDGESTPRKLRKGTRSCTECRRRKTKCTFKKEGTDKCDECYARRLVCRSQAYGNPGPARGTSEEQHAYSLRERVAYLESLIEDRQGGSGGQSASTSELSSQPHIVTGLSAEGSRSSPENSPRVPIYTPETTSDQGLIHSLFHNDVVRRTDSLNRPFNHLPRPERSSVDYDQLRTSLLSLLPRPEDLKSIFKACDGLWSLRLWADVFPELCTEHGAPDFQVDFPYRAGLKNPAETAKMLLGVLICLDHLPSTYDFSKLDSVVNVGELKLTYLSEIQRRVIHDDILARTFSGVQCTALLARYVFKGGNVQGAWHLFRRAIEFASTTGLYLTPGKRKIDENTSGVKLWLSLCHYDRYLSLLLGYPYGVPDSYITSQTKAILESSHSAPLQIYMLQITEIFGKIVDRNQNASDSLLDTLEIDQSLEKLAAQFPNHWWSLEPNPIYSAREECDRFITQMIHHFTRGLLYLPFMLQSPTDGKLQFCYNLAVESARAVLACYRALPYAIKISPYLGKISTFQVFTMAMLTVVHAVQANNRDSPGSNKQRDEDWSLLMEIKETLRSVSVESGDDCSAQATRILDAMLGLYSGNGGGHSGFEQGKSCKITVPCFGVITITPGAQAGMLRERGHRGLGSSTASGAMSGQQITGVDGRTEHQPPRDGGSLGQDFPAFSFAFENLASLPNIGPGPEMRDADIGNFGDDLWLERDLNYDLQYGWDIDFF